MRISTIICAFFSHGTLVSKLALDNQPVNDKIYNLTHLTIIIAQTMLGLHPQAFSLATLLLVSLKAFRSMVNQDNSNLCLI